jgi:hypothetical protein
LSSSKRPEPAPSCRPIADERDADSVYDDVVAAGEKVELVVPRLKQRKFEQRTGERHWRALDLGCYRAGFLHGMTRGAQVMEGQLDIRVVDRRLEDLAIHLEDGGPGRFGLSHHSAHRLRQGIAFDRTLDLREEAKVPLRTGVTRLVRKPYVQLSAGQRKRPVIEFHQTNQPRSGYVSEAYVGPILFDVIQARSATPTTEYADVGSEDASAFFSRGSGENAHAPHRAVVFAVALAPFSIATIATPAISFAACDPGSWWDPVDYVCRPTVVEPLPCDDGWWWDPTIRRCRPPPIPWQ